MGQDQGHQGDRQEDQAGSPEVGPQGDSQGARRVEAQDHPRVDPEGVDPRVDPEGVDPQDLGELAPHQECRKKSPRV